MDGIDRKSDLILISILLNIILLISEYEKNHKNRTIIRTKKTISRCGFFP